MQYDDLDSLSDANMRDHLFSSIEPNLKIALWLKLGCLIFFFKPPLHRLETTQQNSGM